MPAFATHPNLVIASPPGVVACSAFCSTCYHSASSQRPRVASVLRHRAHALGRSLVLRHPGSRSTQTPSRLAPIWRRRRPLLYRVAPLPFAAADDACEGFCSTRNCSQLTTTGCDNLSPPGRARRVLHRPRSSKMIGLFAVPVAEQKSPSPSRRAARAELPFRRGYAVSESPGQYVDQCTPNCTRLPPELSLAGAPAAAAATLHESLRRTAALAGTHHRSMARRRQHLADRNV